MLDIAANETAKGIFGGILSGIGFGATPGGIAPGTFDANLPWLNNGGGGFFSSLFSGFSEGGKVGGSRTYKDTEPAMLEPGEFVVKRSSVDAIGVSALDQLNKMGSLPTQAIPVVGQGEVPPAITNVYVVSESEKPSMGPKDVLVVVQEDIKKGGTTKKLIQSVVTR